MTAFNPRHACLWIHRYTGLAMAGFLVVAGITGTLLAFHHELDEVFNHKLAYIDNQDTSQLPVAVLHDAVISAYPEHNFSSMPISVAPNRSAVFTVDKVRDKKANKQPASAFQEVYVNPYNGHIIGTRDKNAWAWRNTIWKVFWLHRELLLGDIGKLILGIIALVWTLNCFIGFYLTLPRAVKQHRLPRQESAKKRASLLKRWLPAWTIRRKTNTFKLNYDVHHAFGLWLWLILLVIAWSSVGFNLQQVYNPIMQTLVGLEGKEDKSNKSGKSSAQSVPEAKRFNKAVLMINKDNSIEYLSQQANIAAQKNGLNVEQLLGIRWAEEDKQWQMRFKTNEDIGKKGGASSITVNASDGSVEKVNFAYQNASFGSKVDQWLSTLHMGHISHGIGHLAYQIFLALIGLAVAVLSGTGVYLWYKGRQQRLKSLQKLQ
ncbi:PepSY-associated TM helix domain-containing protein [Psychrobacter sp.]|uniref:PepSY-associated TM helix domain-containing protein n=1 Tax=Psychrobacter sp. TaxID=56811 RepID=UPI003565A2B6